MKDETERLNFQPATCNLQLHVRLGQFLSQLCGKLPNMRARQRWLFPPPRPLLDRLGEEFFRQLPRRPGVYFMCGPGEGVLYVGKAKDLRRRLASYRVANPDRRGNWRKNSSPN